MLRRLARDSLQYGVATLLVRGLQILLLPIYTRVLDVGDYGIVEVATIGGALVNLTVALEVSQGMARYVADSPSDKVRRRYATTAVQFASLAYTAFFLLAWINAGNLSRWLFEGRAGALEIVIIAAALAVNGIFVLLQDLLRWLLRPGAYLAASIAFAAGTALVGTSLVVFTDWGVAGVFLGQLAGAALGLLVSAWSARSLLGLHLDGAALRTMLRFSLPLVLSGAAVFCNTFVDRIVVRELLGLEPLGVYGVAARFASIVGILTVSLQAALTPLIYRHWRDSGTGERLAQVFRFYCVGILSVLGALSLFSSEIVLLATGPQFHDARHLIPVLSVASILATLYVFTPGLFLGERTGKVALLNLTGATLNLILCVALVPSMGTSGAAAATSIAAAFVFAGFIQGGKLHFHVPLDNRRAVIALAIGATLVIVGLAWNTAAPQWDVPQLIFKVAALSLSTILAFLHVLRPEDRLQLQTAIKQRPAKFL